MVERERHDAVPLLAREGHNCWRVRRAERLAVLVDGADYFRAVKAALRHARRSVLVLGWDFDGSIALERGDAPDEPNTLGPLLDHLVRAREALHVRLLIWNPALLSLLERGRPWLGHPRLRFISDNAHPIGAAHHQKLVVIDDRLAFAGGIDLTSTRWDSREHAPDDPRRSDADAESYPPVHDLQLALSGPAAAALGELARERWYRATGERLEAAEAAGADAGPWPEGLPVLLRDVDVAIARSQPAWDGAPAVREVERLYLDMVAAARRHLYIENQYFAARRIGRGLARRLRERDGPEVVVVSCLDPPNLIERAVMGVQRARLYRRLRRFDPHRRMRLLHPTHAGREIKVHSKLTIMDDAVLRVGSANLNNRSMGMDTECDLMLEAGERADVRAAIRALRLDLLAEHLGATAEEVAAAELEAGGIGGAIDRWQQSERRRALTPLDDAIPALLLDIAPDARFIDPDRPYEKLFLEGRRTVEAVGGQRAARRLVAASVAVAALAVAAALRPLLPAEAVAALAALLAPLGAAPDGWLAVALLLLFVAGGLLRLPVPPLVVATGALLGLGTGLAVALAGTLGSAVLLYGLGRLAGLARLRPLLGPQLAHVGRVLALNAAPAVALLRLLPVAGDRTVSLAAGALQARAGPYAAGTILGSLPMVLILGLFGYLLAQALLRPDMLVTGSVVALAAALAFGGLALARALERVAPVASAAPTRNQREAGQEEEEAEG